MSEVKGLLNVFARFRALGKLEPIPNAQMCLFFEKIQLLAPHAFQPVSGSWPSGSLYTALPFSEETL